MPAKKPATSRPEGVIAELANIATVIRRTTLSRPTIYRLIRSGAFPRPVKIGLQRVAWLEADLQAWFAKRGGEK